MAIYILDNVVQHSHVKWMFTLDMEFYSTCKMKPNPHTGMSICCESLPWKQEFHMWSEVTNEAALPPKSPSYLETLDVWCHIWKLNASFKTLV